MRDVYINLIVPQKTPTGIDLILSKHAKENNEDTKSTLLGVMTDEPIIFESNGRNYSLDDLLQMTPDTKQSKQGCKYKIDLLDHVLRVKDKDIQIDGVVLSYDVEVDQEQVHLSGADLVKAIVKDAQSGETKYVKTDTEVRQPRR
ncbi:MULTISPECIES: hypothetical protein [unclassified Pseudovibrio]|uniref:hypothetical protein n=1 Tax=unclassified Pseudovibrio TaxID=2627060 RepID=UPI0007AEB342|nr:MULTISPECIES: hypothetical protein [unclassified Pseudovibrio]KZK94446.1 hypothetical protein PsW74_04588 [Pseudovibrio sp. W74]KZL07194.1 hypothetical protein PsAD14_04209 [Pseudovibrio sp. Ad14]